MKTIPGKYIVIALILALIALTFLYIQTPKISKSWGSATGQRADCECWGTETTEGWIGGSRTMCKGVVYDCKTITNPKEYVEQ